MIERPIFKAWFHIEVREPEGVFLLSEYGYWVLRGELYCWLAPLLDGRHTTDELVDALAGRADSAEVYYALERLEAKGYIAEGTETMPGRVAFWQALGVDARVAECRLRETPVRLTCFGAISPGALLDALAAMGIDVAENGRLGIVVTEDYLHEDLAVYNADALASGRPWLLVKPVGTLLWIGPVFHPGTTACWECLAERLRANRPVESFLHQRQESQAPFPVARATLATSLDAAYRLAALEAAKAIARGEPKASETALVTLDLLTLTTQKHVVVRRPQCPRCRQASDAQPWQPTPVVLHHQGKAFTADGGHRTVPPESTLAKYQHHVSPISGAVNLLVGAPVPASVGLHVYVAGNNIARKADSLDFLRGGLRSRTSGKGVTDAQAKTSGLCEALERYSGAFQGDEARLRASYRALDANAIHPNACMLYSEARYASRAAWNARGAMFTVVPEPFDETAEVDWTPAWSLTKCTFKYLPTGYCYYGYPMSPGSSYYWADSNGNAAGNTMEEAILHGLLELMERDGVALWWYNRVRRPAVDLDTFAEPYIDELRAQYRRRGREFWVLDLTSDLEIPVFVSLSRRADQADEEILMGFGAHLDARIGVLRALTEMNQILVFASSAGGNGHSDERRWLRTATVANQPYLVAEGTRVWSDYRRLSSDDVAEDVRYCQRIVESHGMEVLVLDQTRPDIGLPVVKVIVPGLRHFWARYAPGRLYDVPVQLGLLSERLPESQLNPMPMFL